MKKILLAAFASTILFASCSTKKVVDINNLDKNEVVTLKVGETYKFKVKENPSTGHRWRTTSTPNCNVSIADQFIEGKKADEIMVGVPGTKFFDIKADSKGECTVTFDHVGPGSNAPVVDTRVVKFIVK